MYATILGSSCAVILTLFGVAWMISGRISKLEEQVRASSANLPALMKGAILEHQIKCPQGVTPKEQARA